MHTPTAQKSHVAILGSGNIATDLTIKLSRSSVLTPSYMVGIDPHSKGLQKASSMGLTTTFEGLPALLQDPLFEDIDIIYDATSATAHHQSWQLLKDSGKTVIDLTPAAIGPYCVPVVNQDVLSEDNALKNINCVTCGGQATIPMVAAVASVAPVDYAEIVACIASKSAGIGTRENIDEFTQTTARALETVGGAKQGKAIIVLNPAEPPLMMRNTVYCLVDADANQSKITQSIMDMAHRVKQYVPGYKIVNGPVFDKLPEDSAVKGLKISIFIEVTGRGDFLPSYAGNLDIMTASAVAVGERFVYLAHKAR